MLKQNKSKNLCGGYQIENQSQHIQRINGIITNMIEISNSSDRDIINILQNEYAMAPNVPYSQQGAIRLLQDYYSLHPEKLTMVNAQNRKRDFPSLQNRFS